MIRQVSGAGPDGHIVNSVGVKHGFCRLRAGETPPVGHAAVPLEISADLRLRPDGQDQNGNQQDAVDVIGQKITVTAVITVIRHGVPPVRYS